MSDGILPEDFTAWRQIHFRSQQAAADAFGKHRTTIAKYETKGVPAREAVTVALAMRALADGRTPWAPDQAETHSPIASGAEPRQPEG